MPLPQEKRYTMTDDIAWDESERIELIDGRPYMLVTPIRAHQEALTALMGQLYDYLKGKRCKVYPAPFAVCLFEQDGDDPDDVDTLVEPDITVKDFGGAEDTIAVNVLAGCSIDLTPVFAE